MKRHPVVVSTCLSKEGEETDKLDAPKEGSKQDATSPSSCLDMITHRSIRIMGGLGARDVTPQIPRENFSHLIDSANHFARKVSCYFVTA